MILVKAGGPTDAVIDGLAGLLDEGDIIIDGGNAHWEDTIRREKTLTAKACAHRLGRVRRRGGPLRPR